MGRHETREEIRKERDRLKLQLNLVNEKLVNAEYSLKSEKSQQENLRLAIQRLKGVAQVQIAQHDMPFGSDGYDPNTGQAITPDPSTELKAWQCVYRIIEEI